MMFKRVVGGRRERPGPISANLKRRAATGLAALAAALVAVAVLAPAAGASFGQIGSYWGSYGSENGQFQKPSLFGADPVDGSVYVGDEVSEENFRIQKLS